MAAKKTTAKTAAAAAQAAQEKAVEAVEMAVETAEIDQSGVDIKDTLLDNVEGDLMVVDADRGLNLRKGPAKSFPVVEVLEDGTVVKALGTVCGVEVPGWSLIHTGQRTGWVDRNYLRALEV